MNSFNGSKKTLRHGDVVEFNCENGFIKDEFYYKNYTFECTNGYFNETLTYEDLMCKSDFHKHTEALRIPNLYLGSKLFSCNGKNLEVYQVRTKNGSDGTTSILYNVCFDTNVMRAKFVFQPKRTDNPVKSNVTRQDVWGFDFFGKDSNEKFKLSQGYVSKIQRDRLTAAFPNKYNSKKKYPFTFNRGHLAPYADFIDLNDKKASCEYINAAPQWKEFNANSWSLVEKETRALVRDNPGEWEIYTGLYGSIPTTRGPLYASPMFNDKGKFVKGYLPIPKLFWKLVYNLENKNNSKVFVGVNNPELDSPEKFKPGGYLICKPKMNGKGTYFSGNEFKGFTYECDLNEFLINLGKEEKILKVLYDN